MKTYLKVIVPRSGYTCTSVGVRMYIGRSSHVPRSRHDDNVVHFREQEGSFNGTNKATGCIQQLLSAARGFYLLNAKVQLYYNNVGKIGTRKLASIASLKQFLHKIMQI